MEKGSRKVVRINFDTYEYINSIGEVFTLKYTGVETENRRDYAIEGDVFYYENDMENPERYEEERVSSGNHLRFNVYGGKKYLFIEHAGLENNFTDIGKNKGSIILLLDKWYKKYGYPK